MVNRTLTTGITKAATFLAHLSNASKRLGHMELQELQDIMEHIDSITKFVATVSRDIETITGVNPITVDYSIRKLPQTVYSLKERAEIRCKNTGTEHMMFQMMTSSLDQTPGRLQ